MAKITGPSIEAAGGKAEQLVILCHGYGADGNDLIGLAPHWQRLLPNAAFISPNAPQRCDAGFGYQWFPISRLDPAELMRGVESAAGTLNDFIDEELARRGLDDAKLALVGFSQGTMMSLHVGLRRAHAPAAIVGYSGALAGGDRLKGELKGRPPVLLVHGDADEMLPVSRMHDAVRVLAEAGISVQWHVAHGVGHGIDPEGLELGGRFLRDAFAGAFAGAATGD
ncbi:MAG: alpha/beta fold hydrolase [Parvibaculum sp.]|uniref:alpha/beta hydrolase n=1 Tax=Parvibaculum sp. TaxID=2024848 RepID=UPI0025E950F4|nr:alpha/beta fold hydrolase [Parvibaculum sp.]MCE9651110.1 alpha/beta fold hydrolase [Parvibaculum sp.]